MSPAPSRLRSQPSARPDSRLRDLLDTIKRTQEIPGDLKPFEAQLLLRLELVKRPPGLMSEAYHVEPGRSYNFEKLPKVQMLGELTERGESLRLLLHEPASN